MADLALSSVGNVFKLGWAIKNAVATDRRNKEEYRGIVKCVDRVSRIMWSLREATGLLQHPVMSAVLDDLANSLEEALKLINDCQGRKTITRLLWAGHTANELRRVKDDIEQKLLVGMFAGMMQVITLTATIQQPQGRQNVTHISMLSISVDLDCCRCYRKIKVTLWKLREMGIMKIEFDNINNMVSVSGPFDPDWLSCMLIRKSGKVINMIEIMEEPIGKSNPGHRIVEEPIGGTDPGPKNFAQGTHLSSAQAQRPPRDDDVRHTSNSKGSEGSLGPTSRRAPCALTEGHEASPLRSFSLQIPWGRAPGHCTRPSSAAESRVQPQAATSASRSQGAGPQDTAQDHRRLQSPVFNLEQQGSKGPRGAPLRRQHFLARGTKGVVPERRPWR